MLCIRAVTYGPFGPAGAAASLVAPWPLKSLADNAIGHQSVLTLTGMLWIELIAQRTLKESVLAGSGNPFSKGRHKAS